MVICLSLTTLQWLATCPGWLHSSHDPKLDGRSSVSIIYSPVSIADQAMDPWPAGQRTRVYELCSVNASVNYLPTQQIYPRVFDLLQILPCMLFLIQAFIQVWDRHKKYISLWPPEAGFVSPPSLKNEAIAEVP